MNETSVLPEGYDDFVEQLKSHVRAARTRAARVVNTELLLLYWDIGRAILDRQAGENGVRKSSTG